jgi:hypothetical protein
MDLANELGRAIDRALTSTKAEPRYRVFVNGALNYRACADVARRWSARAGDPVRQLRAVVGDNAVLALNDLGSWNADLRRCLAADDRPLPAAVAAGGAETVDVYAFVTTSPGWTAFGAHVDFEHSIILDLAGAGRNVVTWPEGASYGQRMDDAEAFFGISFDWQGHAGSASTSTVVPGEIAVVRARQPHVFHANGAGMFLGLSCVGGDPEGVDVPVSTLAQGSAFIPSRDVDFLESITSGDDPPRVTLRGRPEVDVANRLMSFAGRSVTLTEEERDRLMAGRALELILDDYEKRRRTGFRALIAKLVLVGAAVAC